MQQQQSHHHNQEGTHHFAAGPQAGEICVQTDGRKERHHQRVFQTHIKVDFPTHAFFQHQQRQRHQQATRNGFRDGVFFQEGDILHELSAQQQHQCCGNERR